MTDRLNALTVVLSDDIREDVAQALIQAIWQFRGVLSVTPNVAQLEDHIAQQRAHRDLSDRLWEVLYPKNKP